jgi:Flp pilus assembly pilin Flp
MSRFLRDESGAVTVDWVVLTAATVGLGIASVGAVRLGVGNMGGNISASLSNAYVAGSNMVASTLFTPNLDGQGISARSWGFDTDASYDLGGWERVDRAFGVQLIRDGHAGANSQSGGFMIDMAYGGNTSLARTLRHASDGQPYTVSILASDSNYAWNSGQAAAVNSRLEVWYGGQQVGTIRPGSAQMQNYDFQITGGMGDGSNRLELRSGQDNTSVYGVLLEDVVVR